MGKISNRDTRLYAVALVVVKGNTQTEIARRFGITRQTMWRWMKELALEFEDIGVLQETLGLHEGEIPPVPGIESELEKTKADLERAKHIIEENKKTIKSLEDRLKSQQYGLDLFKEQINTLRWCIQQLGGK